MQGFLVGIKGNQLEKAIEEVREKMHTSINVNGKLSPVTIKLSQELDKLVVAEQLRRMRG
ncbi:Sporulation stage 0, Spo0E-like regulatory phosphatase [Clostridium sp. DL-VIII]|uniref:aspartyl-phosphate phosphatase Spo0E family protein n=1 Tax=Clostridium sp. DL-VIII TaxID=641107 RepID=UPI00023AF7AF|nr:aspartyl-phosphate phosphatase Spo0E family protein [Clostridium sp. DL-VIII]EHI98011.1 Sporulation stage 0, Spo0E-like regulatory phosphatase [Clostridium sp. DL-VIII]